MSYMGRIKKGTGDLHEEKEYCDDHDNGNDHIWCDSAYGGRVCIR